MVGRRQNREIWDLSGGARRDSFIRFQGDKEREPGRYGDDPSELQMDVYQLVVGIVTTYCNKFSDLIAVVRTYEFERKVGMVVNRESF
jgi:hypothetical protein